MRLDTLVAKPEHIFPTNSTPFCGSPIYGMDTLAMEDAHNRDIENMVRENQRSPVGNRAEVMAGEVICADNIIRRLTAREVTGEHHAMGNALSMWHPRGKSGEGELPEELLCVSLKAARIASEAGSMVTWPSRLGGEELAEVHT